MLRLILPILLIIISIGVISEVGRADVSGSFNIDITLDPQSNASEIVLFGFDFQSNLLLNVTISGITIQSDFGLGITGIEFAIIILDSSIGALQFSNEVVFAEPFSCSLFPAGVSNTSGGIVGQCPGDFVVAIGDGNADGIADKAMGFVQNRVEMELSIGGVTLKNLVIFEDVDFPDIQGINPVTGLNDHEHDHFGAGVTYFVGNSNRIVDDQTPTMGFGDVIEFSGQTPSGITLTGSASICASSNLYIKKRNWEHEVNDHCISQPGQNTVKPSLLFDEETLSVEGLVIGNITFNTYWTFSFLNPATAMMLINMPVFNAGTIQLEISSDNITQFWVNQISALLTTGILSVQLIDFGGDGDIDLIIGSVNVVLNPDANPADFGIQLITVQGVGVVRIDLSIGITRGLISLASRTRFSGAGTVAWTFTTFSLNLDSSLLSFATNFQFTPNGMGTSTIGLSIKF